MMRTNMKQLGMRAVVLLATAIPSSTAFAQYVGTSHPDDVPVATSGDSAAPPAGYVPTPKPSAAHPATIESNPAPAQANLPVERQNSFADSSVSSQTNLDEHRLAEAREADAGVVTHVDAPANGLAAGTLVKVKMMQSLSTERTQVGTEWTAELTEPVERNGRVFLPAGALVRGKVTDIHGGRRISGRASMHLEPNSVVLPDGSTLALHAQVIDTDLNHAVKVDDEGTILRRDHKAEEGSVLALTTGSGAVAGALVAGPPGALVGAGVGAGVSTALWLKEDRQADLPVNTRITLELTRPIIIGQQ